MLTRLFALLAVATGGVSALALPAGCGGSIVVVGDGGPSGTGDDSGGSSGGQGVGNSNGGVIGGNGGTGGTGGTNPIAVDPCPTEVPTPGSLCAEPGHGCAYITTDTTGTTSCYPVLCDQTGHWQAATTGCQ
jgi:hypothetical protein